MSGQSKRASLIEASLNTASGFALSFVLWHFVGPLFGYEVTWADNLGITAVFTCSSIARGYLWRRLFNRLR